MAMQMRTFPVYRLFNSLINDVSVSVPTAPGEIVVTQRTTEAPHLKWSSPASMDGAPSTSYRVFYQATTGGTAVPKNEVTTPNNHIVLSTLSSGTRFSIKVLTEGPLNLRSVWTPMTTVYTCE